MNQLFIHKAMDFIQENAKYSKEEMNKIEYGLEGVYLTLSKIIIIVLLSFIFHYFSTVILTLLFFNILRFFAFGLHAKKSIHCLLLSLLQFNVLPYVFLHISFHYYFIVGIFIFTFISFLLFAPSDTEKRPLTNRKKRIIRKILSIISIILLFVLMNYYSIFKIPILCAFIIESFMINPISYYLLGLPYHNYKKMA